MRFKLYALIFLLAVTSGQLLVWMVKRTSSNSRLAVAREIRTEQAIYNEDEEILKEVEDFASGDESRWQEAWSKLESQPRHHLVAVLSRIRNSLPENDCQRVFIAFVLCHLDYEYQSNRRIVISSLAQTPRYKSYQYGWAFDGDFSVSLINRLIKRGDKNLWPVLFASAPWSDGAWAEELAGIFADEMLSNPQNFLLELKSSPQNVRRQVYEFIEYGSDEEGITKMKRFLSSVPKNSPIAHVVKEMLGVLSRYKPPQSY